MNILIIDDELLARNELSFLLSQCKEACEIWEGESVEDAFKIIREGQPDLLFLDIQLIGESGLTLAEKLNKVPNPPLIIFATAYDDYAVKAFELNALDYVLKPFEFKRVEQAVKKAYSQYSLRQKKSVHGTSLEGLTSLPVQINECIYLLKFDEIQFLEVQGKQTTIHLDKQSYTTSESLSTLAEKLVPHYFLRVHRSYIINQHKIKEVQPWFNQTILLTMNNGEKVPVSRSYGKALKEQIGL